MKSSSTDGTAHQAWIDQIAEPALDPEIPICDPHHHLWMDEGHTGWPYTLTDLHSDLATGHNVVRTVFLECRTEYRADGPEHLRPIGETEFVARLADQRGEHPAEIAGVVGFADLTRRDVLEEVLAAHDAAANGRFRGIRYTTAQHDDPRLAMRQSASMSDPDYLNGVRTLGRLGYSYDAMVYHPQLPELAAVAQACPDTTIVVNHLGGFIGAGPYKGQREAVLTEWRDSLKLLAACPNTCLKLGGIGMPMMGFRWDKQDAPPTSEVLAEPWRDPIRFAIDTFGPKRCMFESNFPVDKRGAGYSVLWNTFKRITSDYSESDKRELFHNGAARAYRLPLVD